MSVVNPLSARRSKEYNRIFKGAAVLTTFAALYIVTSSNGSTTVKAKSSIKGLYNSSGNDCFLNSVLQALASQSSLTQFLQLRASSSTLYAALLEFLKNLNSGSSKPTSANSFLNILEKITNKVILRSLQQDAHEFLQYLLEIIESQDSSLPSPSSPPSSVRILGFPAQLPFIGFILQTVQCSFCSAKTSTNFKNTILQLSFPYAHNASSVSLSQLFASNAFEQVDDFKCDACYPHTKKTTSCYRMVQWKRPPTLLQIQLERSCYTPLGLSRNNTAVHYEKSFVLQNRYRYHLRSVITHHGGANSGHYICYRKKDNCWWSANDTIISKCTIEKVLDQHRLAFMLFYEMESPSELD
ncbi:mitochondrial outer membrane anchored ubiquitin C-terminal hydrolase Ubp11 [Schizosaccharomyces osmophilus]|uniref:Mitochondrial outer membrane anchored ubiquitin C-terminal hydrolase Ubp11 n=1 Tax=Schizosaccharomyces osmophilus TaxID=2545709 RepID=A0AAF0AU42_9SCHI|nr:mitochondrial outer membrane anchored ubiquitin C-terminal hydrolase Ubp11 [Schizosaccharomyces osmophilus]WBW72091.1 mitochondrial outer membrane anchored ubiquitin C-terminal hydrolase Ubp11 [Schizosaccharomyces osmophilus]